MQLLVHQDGDQYVDFIRTHLNFDSYLDVLTSERFLHQNLCFCFITLDEAQTSFLMKTSVRCRNVKITIKFRRVLMVLVQIYSMPKTV